MVEVHVRDQRRVHAARQVRRDRRDLPAQVRNATAQQRIGEQPHTAELEQEGRVTKEDDTVLGCAGTLDRDSVIGHGRAVNRTPAVGSSEPRALRSFKPAAHGRACGHDAQR